MPDTPDPSFDTGDSEPATPLTILEAIPPEPHYGPGTYEVRLKLSRPLTPFEVQALKPIAHGMHPVRCVLILFDTTLERVAAQAHDLAAMLRQVEADGRRLELAAAERNRRQAARVGTEAARLTALAHSITFD